MAAILPVVAVLLWQAAGTDGALAGGALPTPDRVWSAWITWAFGKAGPMTLSPYVGSWAENLGYSAMRVAKAGTVAGCPHMKARTSSRNRPFHSAQR